MKLTTIDDDIPIGILLASTTDDTNALFEVVFCCARLTPKANEHSTSWIIMPIKRL